MSVVAVEEIYEPVEKINVICPKSRETLLDRFVNILRLVSYLAAAFGRYMISKLGR